MTAVLMFFAGVLVVRVGLGVALKLAEPGTTVSFLGARFVAPRRSP